jgi:outer membrane murein-binding lipoprotein Lpp
MSRQPSETADDDYLTEDPEISSQKIVLLSFLSPEKILANKDVFFFKNFVSNYALQWRTAKLEAWLASQVSALNTKVEELAGKLEKPDADAATLQAAASDLRQNLFRVDTLVEEFQQYARKNLSELATSTIQEEFDTFLYTNGQKLEEEFFKANEFRTTMRGIKVRGVFSSEAEASAKAKRLQKTDPTFNIYMGHVGKWMAWEPDPNKVGEQEYANEELNTLMKKYRENEENRDVFYTEQKKTRMGAAKTKLAEVVAPEATLTTNVPGSESVPVSEGTSSYDGLFSGTADLAIARKLEAKLEAKGQDS